jgi:hypothetical protein
MDQRALAQVKARRACCLTSTEAALSACWLNGRGAICLTHFFWHLLPSRRVVLIARRVSLTRRSASSSTAEPHRWGLWSLARRAAQKDAYSSRAAPTLRMKPCRVRAGELAESLRRHVTEHHRFLLKVHLDQINSIDQPCAPWRRAWRCPCALPRRGRKLEPGSSARAR